MTHSRFPANRLRPAGGTIFAHVFENAATGIARDLFWSFSMRFRRLSCKGQFISPSATIEWIRVPIRRWQDLSEFSRAARYGHDGAEASFYVWSHECASRWRLAVLDRVEARFLVRMELHDIDFTGWDGTDADSHLGVAGETWLNFRRLLIPRDDLVPKVNTIEEARDAGERFLDMNGFNLRRGSSFEFTPRRDARRARGILPS
jgi:hypothetical protein